MSSSVIIEAVVIVAVVKKHFSTSKFFLITCSFHYFPAPFSVSSLFSALPAYPNYSFLLAICVSLSSPTPTPPHSLAAQHLRSLPFEPPILPYPLLTFFGHCPPNKFTATLFRSLHFSPVRASGNFNGAVRSQPNPGTAAPPAPPGREKRPNGGSFSLPPKCVSAGLIRPISQINAN